MSLTAAGFFSGGPPAREDFRSCHASPSSDPVFFRRRCNDLTFPWRACLLANAFGVAHHWGEGGNESRQRKLTFRRDPDFQDRKSLPTLRRSQLLRDLLITSGGVAGSNSRLWRSQARDFRGPKRFLHLFSCAIASIFIVPTSNFLRVTTKTSPSFALSIICSASAIVWSSKQ